MAENGDAPSFTLTADGARSLLPHIRCACHTLAGIATLHRAAGFVAQANDAVLAMQKLDAFCLTLETIVSLRPTEPTTSAPPDVLESCLASLGVHPHLWH
jgi:hypothetical protein